MTDPGTPISFASDTRGLERVLPGSAAVPVLGGAPHKRRPRRREPETGKARPEARRKPAATTPPEQKDDDKGTRVDIRA